MVNIVRNSLLVLLAMGLGHCARAEGEEDRPRRHRHVEDTSKLLHPQVEIETTETGEKITRTGGTFIGATEVSLTELLENPSKLVKKTVQITGNVSAMCTHRRAWFAIVADDKSGRHVRVVTAPVFLVPHDAIGKTVRVEGTVEIEPIGRDRAKYLMKEHKLFIPEGATEQVTLRATAAEFR